MDSKKTIGGATTHTRSAPLPKVFLFLICFLILNCSFAFALTEEQIDGILTTGGFPNGRNMGRWSKAYDHLKNADEENVIISTSATFGTGLYIFITENVPYVSGAGAIVDGQVIQIIFSKSSSNIEIYSYTNGVNITNAKGKLSYYPKGLLNADKTTYYYEPGYDGFDLFGKPIFPWFEFSSEKIGTTTLENEDGNINVYYPTSFKTWANSYMSGKEIGFLYIPKGNTNYNTTFSYLTKSNLNMTQSWEYINNSIFKEEETNTYTKYSINLENYLVSAPYFYNIKIDNITNDEDINIKFVIINQTTTDGTIVDNSGDIISGDATKDETTIGDLQNTLTEPYNPNNNILNNMKSGDILGNIGYNPTNDPNNDLWETIINGLKQTLTGNGAQEFSFKLRKTEHTISSDDLYIPDGEIKTYISLFVNFWLLMQMFQFIKRTIDQINEGNLKVMHDVDADCYFF